MNTDNMNEADFIKDGADYLEEHQCKPCDDCRKKECSDFCAKYDKWFWNR